MRTLQVGLFAICVLAFVLAIFFIGQEMGDVLWRAGVAFILIDLACIKLWPAHPAK
jgi:hypothetical protein